MSDSTTSITVTREDLDGSVLSESIVEVQSMVNSETEKKDYYLQKYKKEWELLPEFSEWLSPVPDEPFRALCRVCKVHLRCHKMKLHGHSASKKHATNMERARLVGVESDEVLNNYDLVKRRPRPLHGKQRNTPKRVIVPVRRYTDQMVSDMESETVDYSDVNRVSFSIGLGEHTVGFIGGGEIAGAIAKSMLDKVLVIPTRLFVSSAGTGGLAQWRRWGAVMSASVESLIRACSIVFLAVPAAELAAVFAEIGVIDDGLERCIISLVPELSKKRLHEILDGKFPTLITETPSEQKSSKDDQPETSGGENSVLNTDDSVVVTSSPSYHLVRLTTNLTARTSHGCCAYSADRHLPHRWLLCVEVVCGAMGHSCRLPDSQLEAYSAVLCAAPAFTLEFSEALSLSAASVAIPWHLSRKLVAQTLIGVGELLLNDQDTSTLMDDLSPPGSCVIAGLAEIQRGGLRCGMIEAVRASVKDLRQSDHH